MADLQSIVGARLEVTGADAAVGELQKFNDELKITRDNLIASAEASAVMAGSLKKTALASTVGAKASRDSTVVAGGEADAALAVTAAKTKLATALERENKARKSAGDLLVSAGKSPLGKLGEYGMVAGVAAAYESIKTYTQFQAAQTKLVTLAGVQKKNLPGLTSLEVSSAQKYAISLNDMANGTYRLASATVGLKNGPKLLKQMIPAFAQAATVLQTTPGSGTTQLARVFGAFFNSKNGNKLQGVGSSQHVAAMLAAAAGAGDTTGTDIVSSLGSGILQQGSALHMKASDLLGYVDLSTRYAANPKTAGTLVAHTLAMISNPSAQGQAAEEMFGIEQGKLRTIAAGKGGVPAAVAYVAQAIKSGLHPTSSLPYATTVINGKRAYGDQGTIQAAAYRLDNWGVKKSTANTLLDGGKLSKSDETSLFNLVVGKAFGGGKQEATFLTAANNPKIFQAIVKYINGNSTKAQLDKKLALTESTPSFKEHQAFNDIKIDFMKVGKEITPAWLKLLSVLENTANWFSKNATAAKALFGVLGGVVALGAGAFLGGKAVKAYRGVNAVKNGVAKLFGGGTEDEGVVAARTQLEAAEMQLEAARLGGSGGLPGKGVSKDVRTAENVAGDASSAEQLLGNGTKAAIAAENTAAAAEKIGGLVATFASLSLGTIAGLAGLGIGSAYATKHFLPGALQNMNKGGDWLSAHLPFGLAHGQAGENTTQNNKTQDWVTLNNKGAFSTNFNQYNDPSQHIPKHPKAAGWHQVTVAGVTSWMPPYQSPPSNHPRHTNTAPKPPSRGAGFLPYGSPTAHVGAAGAQSSLNQLKSLLQAINSLRGVSVGNKGANKQENQAISQAGSKDLSQGAKDLRTGTTDWQKSISASQKAATLTGSNATKESANAASLLAAAKAHATAAKQLEDAGNQLKTAASALQNIKVTVNQSALASAVVSQINTNVAHGKG